MIRDMADHDFDDVYAIYMDDAVNPFMHYEKMGKNDFRTVFNEMAARSYAWVLENEGTAVAMCSAIAGTARTDHTVMLTSLGVLGTAQGAGFGRQIVEHAVTALRTDGFRRISLIAECDNEGAIAFYNRLGFKVDGTIKDGFKRGYEEHYVDQFLMSLG
jgi:putative acetyltransferase